MGYKGLRVQTGGQVVIPLFKVKKRVYLANLPLRRNILNEIFLGFLLFKFHENHENVLLPWISGTPQSNAFLHRETLLTLAIN